MLHPRREAALFTSRSSAVQENMITILRGIPRSCLKDIALFLAGLRSWASLLPRQHRHPLAVLHLVANRRPSICGGSRPLSSLRAEADSKLRRGGAGRRASLVGRSRAPVTSAPLPGDRLLTLALCRRASGFRRALSAGRFRLSRLRER
jgi:hypothetical protein